MSSRPKCSLEKFGKKPMTQHLYQCLTCKFRDDEVICESCAHFCHQAHILVDLGYIYGYCSCGYGSTHCHCFLIHPVPGDDQIPDDHYRQCNFLQTGSNFVPGLEYHCDQCRMVNSACMCYACMAMCHRGHHGCGQEHSGNYYCDCGDPNCAVDYHCKIRPKSYVEPPLHYCHKSLHSSQYKNPKPSSKCTTCGIFVCQECRQMCHKNHQFSSETSRECQCGNGCECVLEMQREPAA